MSSSDITVIAARRAIGVPIQSVFRDWTGISLIRPVLIVDLDGQLADGTIPAVVFEGGSSRPVLLQEELGRSSNDLVRLCAVTLVDEADGVIDPGQGIAVAGAIRDAVPAASLIQAQLIVGSPGGEWANRIPPLLGWHNLALSPEESQAPDKGASPLSRSWDDPRWLFSVVGALCSVGGLWPGQVEGVLDHRQPAPGGGIVPVRSFVRSLSADAVERGVERRLFTFGDHYPAPRVESGTAVVVPDEGGAAVAMADTLIAKYPDVMPRTRVFPAPPPREDIGFMKALKQLFAFLGQALRNAPRAFAESLLRSASTAVASRVQNVVFGGADSAYQVVVRGVRADGAPASWSDYERDLESVYRRTSPNSEVGAPPQNPELWSDFVDGALTLLDAGARKPDLPFLTSGIQRAVVSTTDKVAPSPIGEFTLPPQLAAFMTSWEVQPGDDIDAGRLYDELPRRLGSKTHLTLDVRNEQQRLQTWAEKGRQSYVGRVGRRLGDAYRGLVKELDALEKKIVDLTAAASMPDDIGKEQEALAKRLRIFTIIMVLLMIGMGVLLGLAIVTVLVGVLVIVGLLLGWLIGGTLMYMKTQKKLYQFLNAQRSRVTELDTALRHRTEAMEDLRRITRAYRQYLDWSRALSAFVHAPLGSPVEKDAKTLVVGQGLPRSIGVGVALPNQEAVEEVANQWRQKLFRVGWLQDAWREYLTDVPASLGALRHQIQSDPDLLLQDQSIDSEGSLLTRWSRAVTAAAATRPASQTFVQLIQSLTETDTVARDRLLSRVAVRDAATGEVREQSRRQFDEGLDRDYSGAQLSFMGGMFSPTGVAVDARLVRDQVLQLQSRGLDSATVLVQFGGAFGPEQFVTTGTIDHPVGPGVGVPPAPEDPGMNIFI